MKKFLVVLLISLFCFIPVNAKDIFNNGTYAKVVSGDLNTVGSEVCIGKECFYIIGNDGNNVKLFAKYNLYVGNSVDKNYNYTKLDETFSQNSGAIGYRLDKYASEKFPFVGTVAFSSSSNKYDGSIVEEYVNNYKEKIEELGVSVTNARLINESELVSLGCDKNAYWCGNAPKWVYSTSYWVDVENSIARYAWYVDTYSYFVYTNYYTDYLFGVRPVIEIPTDSFIPSKDEDNIYFGELKTIESSDGVVATGDKSLNIKFNDLGQKVKYETTIYNNKDKKYYVRDIITKNISGNFIDLDLDSKSENLVLEPNGSANVTFYARTLVKEGAGKDLEDYGHVAFLISDKNFNPETFSNINEMLILLLIFGGTLFFIYKKNKKLKYLLIILSALFIGYNVYAEDFDEIIVDFNVIYESQNFIETTGITLSDKTSDYTNAVDVWTYSDKIKNVYIKSLISEPKKYYKKFDLTLNDNNRVLGYLVENNDNIVPYDLYIMANGVIKANEDSSFLFSFPNVLKVEGISNFDYSDVNSAKGMFLNTKKLKNINSKDLNLSNVRDISYLFYNSGISEFEESNYSTSKVVNREYMFNKDLYRFVKKGSVKDKDLDYFNTNGNGNFVINSTVNDDYPIYYYRGDVTNNNVKLGNMCWKIVRTTDTGGIKLIYNGLVDSYGNCNTSTVTIASSKFSNATSLAGAGYMYGSTYSVGSFSTQRIDLYETYKSIYTTQYYFGSDYSYSDGKYTLNNPELISYTSNKKDVTGYYTCLSSSEYSCNKLYYVVDGFNSTIYVSSISNNDVDSATNIYLYKGYKLNAAGKYDMTGKTKISKSDYISDNSKYVGYYYCNVENNCSDVGVIKTTSDKSFTINKSISFAYGNSFEYTNGNYVLKNIYKSSSNDDNKFSDYRYTCGSNSTSCSKLLHALEYDDKMYYISLTGGVSIEDAVTNMFENTYSSTIKNNIDTWFSNNMVQYDHLLEDIAWYNDRSYFEFESGGLFDKFNGYSNAINNKFLGFNYTNKKDMFTVSNENGNKKLTYPVGLITMDELILAGNSLSVATSTNYLCSGSQWWSMTPATNEKYAAYIGGLSSYGQITKLAASSSYGIRPMVSLKNSIIVTQGDGTVEKPYVIEIN